MVVEGMNEASCGLQGNLISNVLQGQQYGTGEMQSLIFKRIMCEVVIYILYVIHTILRNSFCKICLNGRKREVKAHKSVYIF